MTRQIDDSRKHSFLLAAGDYEWIRDTYPDVSVATVLRAMIQRHRRQVEARVNQVIPIDTMSLLEESLQ